MLTFVRRQRFESIQRAMRVIGSWIAFYIGRQPYQALGVPRPPKYSHFRLNLSSFRRAIHALAASPDLGYG